MADETRVPTEEEIVTLPRWARVAFAIRCAKRVQPLFKAAWPDVPEKHVLAVERAIRCAERLLSGDSTASALAAALAAAIDALAVATAADAAAIDALAAARAAATDAADAAHAAAAHAAAAAADAAAANTITTVIWRDFGKLRVVSEKEHWTDETRPSLESLGPLWLEGEEPDWQEIAWRMKRRKGRAEDKASEAEPDGGEYRFYEQPTIDLYINPGNASKETIQEVLTALSDLHSAAGGLGLEFINDGRFIYAVERVGR